MPGLPSLPVWVGGEGRGEGGGEGSERGSSRGKSAWDQLPTMECAIMATESQGCFT